MIKDLPKEALDIIQKLKEREEITYGNEDDKWDIKIEYPQYGIKGEKFEIKLDRTVKKFEFGIIELEACKWEVKNPAWNKDGKPELFGLPTLGFMKENVDKVESEWKTGNMFNGEFRNVINLGYYLIEMEALGTDQKEQINIKKVIQLVEKKEDLVDIKPEVEEKVDLGLKPEVEEPEPEQEPVKVDIEEKKQIDKINKEFEEDPEMW